MCSRASAASLARQARIVKYKGNPRVAFEPASRGLNYGGAEYGSRL